MRVHLQRVQEAWVDVDGERVGQVGVGYLALVGVGKGDTEDTARALASKTIGLRVFPDGDGRMNRSLKDVGGGCLVVSQFTLYADCSRGRRPYFGDAEAPERAAAICDVFGDALRGESVLVETGVFGADMKVGLVNDGPVTILLES